MSHFDITRRFTAFATRAFVQAAVAGSTCCSAGAVAFAATLTTTATATAAAPRPTSGAFAAIALGALLLSITQRWRG